MEKTKSKVMKPESPEKIKESMQKAIKEGDAEKKNREIAKKASKIIFSNEGGYASVACDDNGALSVGKMQWHGNRALTLLQSILKRREQEVGPESISKKGLFQEIRTAKDWSRRILNKQEKEVLISLLQTDQSKAVQDDKSLADICSYLKKGREYGLGDAGALIYFADGVNQYGTASSLWKNIAKKALADGGDVEAMYNATLSCTKQYLPRRKRVYDAVRSLKL